MPLHIFFACSLVTMVFAVAPSATSQRRDASIVGVVVDAVTGAPIRRATVTAREQQSPSTGARLTVTTDDGRFGFNNLVAGRYVVTATKVAYLATAFGARRVMSAGSSPTGTAIAIRDGEQKADVTLGLTRGAVMTGVVRDGTGLPIRGVSVVAAYWRRSPATGDKVLATSFTSVATTDARGVYRLFGLPPGEYVAVARFSVSGPDASANDFEQTDAADVRRILNRTTSTVTAATTSAETTRAPETPKRPTYGYAPVYHPGTVSPLEATPVVLAAGEERGGIDIRLQTVQQSRISGEVMGLDRKPASGVFLQLMDSSQEMNQFSFAGGYATTDAQGQYTIRGVPRGTYTLDVRASSGRGATGPNANAWGRATVSIAPGEDARVNISLRPGLTISGQLKLDSVPETPVDFTRAQVGLASRTGLSAVGTVAADGQFTITGVMPDSYRWNVAVPPTAWFPRAGVIGDRDATEEFVAITGDVSGASVILTTQVSEVTGVIQDATGQPAPEYFLVIFPANRALWTWQSRRIQQARPSSDGQFAFRSLPPGDYLLGAVTDLEPLQIYESSFLQELLAASPISIKLAEGEKKRQDIRLR